MPQKITINGQVYDDWSQVPPELQKALASALPDDDHDGVPDVFQGKAPEPGKHVFTKVSLNVNGKEYDSAGELPPEISTAMRRVFALGDEHEGASGAAPATPASTPPAPPNAQQGQVVLNGETVDVTADGVAKPKKGFLRRLFG